VKTSIRLRVALGVFLVVAGLVTIQDLYVLSRFERALRLETDGQLDDEISEVNAVVGTDRLQEWIVAATEEHREDSEMFIEVLAADGVVVARSGNVPERGLAPVEAPLETGGTRYWESPHPRSRSGARRIRVAERRDGPWTIRVALVLDQAQRWYWNLRQNLAGSLPLIAGLGALAAWWVAARTLRPIAEIVARARSLGALPDGSLPRTGSGDEVDRLAAVLNDLLQRIRSEVLRVHRLTADVAHALRTPLTAIRGNLELQIGRADAANVDVLESSLEQVDELVRLVNQLLLLEKLEARPLDPKGFARIDLVELARGLVDHLQVIAEERGVALSVQGETTFLRADPAQIRQALANLVDNALRHTPRGGRVEVEIRVVDGSAQVRVADTGPGIVPGDLDRVFERFHSTAEDLAAGTGLGLPIARAIARAHGGDVRATSPGGAVFTLELPLEDGDGH
jgi:signal transduction histidine kinase